MPIKSVVALAQAHQVIYTKINGKDQMESKVFPEGQIFLMTVLYLICISQVLPIKKGPGFLSPCWTEHISVSLFTSWAFHCTAHEE